MLNKIKRYLPLFVLLVIAARFILNPEDFRRFLNAAEPLIGALFIIYLLQPVVNFIQSKFHAKRLIALLISYLLLFIIVGLFFYTLIPSLYDGVIGILPKDYGTFVENCCCNPIIIRYVGAERTRVFLNNIPSLLSEYINPILEYSTDLLSSMASVFKYVGLVLIALTMSFYALLESKDPGSSIAMFLYNTLSTRSAERILSLLAIIDDALKDFLQGKVITCLILGILTTIVLMLCNALFDLDIPNAALFGFLVGITNVIPYVGPLLGTLICVIISLFHGLAEAIVVLGVILVLQQIDNIFLEPRVLGSSCGVSPFWVLTSVTCLGLLFGGMGMILAVPIASVIQQLVMEYQRYQALRRRGVKVEFLQNVPEKWSRFRP